MNHEKIAERYAVTLQEAQQLRSYVDRNIGLDWSEASYKQIDNAMHRASCAVLNRAVTNPEGRVVRKAGMANFRAKLLTAHKSIIASGRVEGADLEFQHEIVDCIEKAQRKFGEV